MFHDRRVRHVRAGTARIQEHMYWGFNWGFNPPTLQVVVGCVGWLEGHGHEQEMTAEKLRLTCMLDDNRTRVELDDEFAPNDTMKWPQLMSYRNCLRRCLDDESKHQPTHSRLVLKWNFKHPQKKGQIGQTVRVALNKKLWWWKENYFGAMGGALFMRLCTIHGLGKLQTSM